MSNWKRLLFVFFSFLVVISLTAGYIYYSKTGGRGLTRVIFYYFFRNIPDKKYSWRDFTDRGENHGISGFYSSGDKNGFSLWTLSGLKGFITYQRAFTCMKMFARLCDI